MSQPFLRNFIILLIYDSVILSYARFTGWYCDEKAVSQCFFLSIIFYCVIIYLIQLFNICYLYNKIAIINITVNKFFLIGNKKAGDSHKPLLRFKSGFVNIFVYKIMFQVSMKWKNQFKYLADFII